MPAWSAAARDLRDVQRLLQRKGQRRDRPRVEGNHGERTTRRYGKKFPSMEKLPRFDRTHYCLPRPANQGNQPN
jgi:hypothetical protein